jgi:hypothetical protein
MEYAGSCDLVTKKMKKINADFHVFGLLMAKMISWFERKTRKLKFWLPESF